MSKINKIFRKSKIFNLFLNSSICIIEITKIIALKRKKYLNKANDLKRLDGSFEV